MGSETEPMPAKKRGPKPDHLKLDEEDWEGAVKRAVEKEKPAEGWPEPAKEPKEG